MDTRTSRFASADSFEGNSSKPNSLHKYSYCEGNPVGKIDPSGHHAQELLAAGLIGAVLAGLAIFKLSGVFRAKWNSGSPPAIPKVVYDQPVIVAGSGWDNERVLTSLVVARNTWVERASIFVVSKPPIVLYPDEVSGGNVLVGTVGDTFIKTGPWPSIDSILSHFGVSDSHVTLFVNTIEAGKTPGRSRHGLAGSYKALSLIANNESGVVDPGFTIAHEWGHTFDLPHHGLRENLMFDSTALLGGNTYLDEDQVPRAYNYAKANY